MVAFRRIRRCYATAVLLMIAILGLSYRLLFTKDGSASTTFQASRQQKGPEISGAAVVVAEVPASRSGNIEAVADDLGRGDSPAVRNQQLEKIAGIRDETWAERNTRQKEEDSALRQNTEHKKEPKNAWHNIGHREEEPKDAWRTVARKQEADNTLRNVALEEDSDSARRKNLPPHPEAEREEPEESHNAERKLVGDESQLHQEPRHANDPGREENERHDGPPSRPNAEDLNYQARLKSAYERSLEGGQEKRHTIEVAGEPVTRPPLQIKPLHRSFSLYAISTGNIYGGAERVAHVVVFCEPDDLTAVLTLVNSVVSNSPGRNLSFHFVTPQSEGKNLKSEIYEIDKLKKLVFEVIEYPVEWTHGKDMMEFASFRLPDLLPYLSGKVVVLDPYSLVTGDIVDVLTLPIQKSDWVAMATLCNQSPSDTTPDRRYKHYLNLTHPLVAKLNLPPDTCAPSAPTFFVADLSQLRRQLVRPQLWAWVRLNDNTPVFLKNVSTAAYSIVFHKHITFLRPPTFVRLNDDSQEPNNRAVVYHWVGKGKPWGQKSPAANLWNKFFIAAPSSIK